MIVEWEINCWQLDDDKQWKEGNDGSGNGGISFWINYEYFSG